MTAETFGQMLRRLRTAHGWKQIDLARNTGVTNSILNRLEHDAYLPVPAHADIVALAKALHTEPTLFLDMAGWINKQALVKAAAKDYRTARLLRLIANGVDDDTVARLLEVLDEPTPVRG